MFFGKLLKEYRLKCAKIGLSNFVQKIEMKVYDYSRLERGLIEYPRSLSWIVKVIDNLNIKDDEDKKDKLLLWWGKPFIMQKMKENIFAIHALDTNGKSTSARNLKKISKYLKKQAKEHNKKADEYNEKKIIPPTNE